MTHRKYVIIVADSNGVTASTEKGKLKLYRSIEADRQEAKFRSNGFVCQRVMVNDTLINIEETFVITKY